MATSCKNCDNVCEQRQMTILTTGFTERQGIPHLLEMTTRKEYSGVLCLKCILIIYATETMLVTTDLKAKFSTGGLSGEHVLRDSLRLHGIQRLLYHWKDIPSHTIWWKYTDDPDSEPDDPDECYAMLLQDGLLEKIIPHDFEIYIHS